MSRSTDKSNSMQGKASGAISRNLTAQISVAIVVALTIVLSIFGLLISVPLLLVFAICIKFDSPGPIFFRQTRVGMGQKDFTLYKLRTMRQDAEEETGAVLAQADDPRVSRFGKFLRCDRFD